MIDDGGRVRSIISAVSKAVPGKMWLIRSDGGPCWWHCPAHLDGSSSTTLLITIPFLRLFLKIRINCLLVLLCGVATWRYEPDPWAGAVHALCVRDFAGVESTYLWGALMPMQGHAFGADV